MKLPICVVLIFLISSSIYAGNKAFIIVGGWSHHLDNDSEMNEVHRSIGLGYEMELKNSVLLSYEYTNFINSFNKESNSINYGFKRKPSPYYWGLKGGVANGYGKSKKTISPFYYGIIGTEIKTEASTGRLELGIIPTIKDIPYSGVLFLTIHILIL